MVYNYSPLQKLRDAFLCEPQKQDQMKQNCRGNILFQKVERTRKKPLKIFSSLLIMIIIKELCQPQA